MHQTRSIRVVEISAMMIDRIIGPFRYEETKATATPAKPAYHCPEKSVRANGKMRAPSAATGSSIMHLRRKRGSFASAEEAKNGIILGSSVTAAQLTISRILFKANLLIRINKSSSNCSYNHGNKERQAC